jgi:hypothetical protein
MGAEALARAGRLRGRDPRSRGSVPELAWGKARSHRRNRCGVDYLHDRSRELDLRGRGRRRESLGGWPRWLEIVFGLILGIVYLIVLWVALHGWRGKWGHDFWGRGNLQRKTKARPGGPSPSRIETARGGRCRHRETSRGANWVLTPSKLNRSS